MDQTRARALLAAERARLERLLQAETGDPQAADVGDEVDDADRRNAEQTGTAVDQLLQARWAALARAEARLAAGSYGRSVRSGRPIPDERLAADPLAELTVEEAAAAERGTLEEGHDAVGLASASHPFEVLTDPRYHPRGGAGQRGGRRRGACPRAEPGHPHRARRQDPVARQQRFAAQRQRPSRTPTRCDAVPVAAPVGRHQAVLRRRLLALFEEGEQVGVELLLWVANRPCGRRDTPFRVASLTSSTDRRAEASMGMIWSSSPWTIKVGAATGVPAAGPPEGAAATALGRGRGQVGLK
jgi:DnaK suppressor protein